MTVLSIKDVPETWAQSLRERAARNHRSLQGELMAIVEAAVHTPVNLRIDQAVVTALDKIAAERAAANAPQGVIVGYDRMGHPIMQRGWKTVAQITATLRARSTDQSNLQALAVQTGAEIIRAERDAR